MKRQEFMRMLLRGAIAGLMSGFIFAIAMLVSGSASAGAVIGSISTAAVGMVVTLVLATVGGAAFAALMRSQPSGRGEMLFWGLSYGALLWFALPLTLVPLLMDGMLHWDVRSAQAAFPSLLGYLVYGAVLGLALAALRREAPAAGMHVGSGALRRGAIAGLIGGALLGVMLDTQGQLLAFAAMMAGHSRGSAWLVTLAIGVVAGVGFSVLYPRLSGGGGPALVRGMVYGFCWWVAGGLTIMALAGGTGPAWSVAAARTGFATFPGYLLFGAAIAIVYTWLDALVRVLFSDGPAGRDEEGAGARGLRAIGRGAVAGLAGGLIFTIIMVEIGFLPVVASLVGSRSVVTGLIVHLIIADLIGASYGLLFRRQSYDLGSALGWGVAYGFFWWILGPLTLLPVLLGAPPRWTVEVATQLMPSLIGHLLYGAGLGITFYLLEARYSPWWIPLTQAEAARAARRKAQLQTSAPALWSLIVIVALTLPILLGM